MSDSKDAASTRPNERMISADARNIFAAFEDADRLARWWGPAGFTNTFDLCEFRPGGRWVYVMHGPDGRDYPNECVFREIDTDKRIVIDHVVLPLYTLTITLEPRDGGTHLTWDQQFENREFADRMRDFLWNANEENLDKLETILAAEK